MNQKWIVSYWRIPGGADYQNAYVAQKAFDSKEEAAEFIRKHSSPPEMAALISGPSASLEGKS